jgi:flagella basal body P-ring formation protein FlgA
MIKFICFLFLFITTRTFSSVCKIETYNYLYRFDEFDRSIIKSTDCNEEKNQKFLSLINSGQTMKIQQESLYADHGVFITNHEVNIQELQDVMSDVNSTLKYRILDIIASSKFLVSDTPIQYKSNALKSELGRYNLEIHTSLGNVYVNYIVQNETQALIAKHDIAAHGNLLSNDDFELKSILIENLNLLPMNNISQVTHMRLNRNLKAGDVLTNNMLYSPELIKFGDVIKTQVESGGVFIEFNARALKPGKLNEIIQLENLNSKKSFGAQVVGPGKIKVLL